LSFLTNSEDSIHSLQIYALHGFTGSGEDFDCLRPHFKGRKASKSLPPLVWTCPSLLGHRTVVDLDCTAPAQLSHFSKQLKASHRGTIRRVLLAYSMGARLALLHACECPDFWDAIILISCHPGIKDAIERIEREKADVALACSIEKKGLAWFLPYWQSLPVIQSQARAPADFRIKMDKRKKKLSPHGLARCLRQFGQGVYPNLWSEAERIRCPILCLHGSEDEKYAAIHQFFCQSLSKTNRLIRSVTIPNSGHAPHIENHEDTAQVIESFLAKVFLSKPD